MKSFSLTSSLALLSSLSCAVAFPVDNQDQPSSLKPTETRRSDEPPSITPLSSQIKDDLFANLPTYQAPSFGLPPPSLHQHSYSTGRKAQDAADTNRKIVNGISYPYTGHSSFVFPSKDVPVSQPGLNPAPGPSAAPPSDSPLPSNNDKDKKKEEIDRGDDLALR